MNLTGITEFDEFIDKHYIDSLSIVNAVDMHQVQSAIDVGTGAGFPGIPLKIAFPHLKITLLVIIAIILVGTFVFLYQKSKPKVIVYETLAAEVTDLEKTTVATGKVEPRDEILIKPQISGIVDEVFKEAGQSVKKGEVIAKVKVIPELGQLNSAESRVRLAEINAKQAETDFTRITKLYEDNLISRKH